MDIQLPTQNSQELPPLVTSPPPIAPKSKPFFSKLSLVVLLLAMILTAAFSVTYYYLNAKVDSVTKILPKPTTATKSTITHTPASFPEKVILVIPKNPEIRNWKTYKNIGVGFTFQYPEHWKEDTASPPSWIEQSLGKTNGVGVGPISTKNHLGQSIKPYVNQRIGIYTAELNNVSIDDILQNYRDLNPSIQKLQINNIDIFIISHTAGIAGGLDVIMRNDETTIIVEAGLAYHGSETEQYGEGILEKLLSTFKFTDQKIK